MGDADELVIRDADEVVITSHCIYVICIILINMF
jgi:hypothetical protein